MKNIIFVAVGDAEPERLELPDNAIVSDLEKMLKDRGVDVSDFLVFNEDNEEPLGKGAKLNGHNHPIFHAHRCRKIEVGVHYGSDTYEHKFAPSVTIATVKRWAVKKVGLGKEEAEEHVLQISGTRIHPPLNAHLGKFTGEKCAVEFDLVRKKLVQG